MQQQPQSRPGCITAVIIFAVMFILFGAIVPIIASAATGGGDFEFVRVFIPIIFVAVIVFVVVAASRSAHTKSVQQTSRPIPQNPPPKPPAPNPYAQNAQGTNPYAQKEPYQRELHEHPDNSTGHTGGRDDLTKQGTRWRTMPVRSVLENVAPDGKPIHTRLYDFCPNCDTPIRDSSPRCARCGKLLP